MQKAWVPFPELGPSEVQWIPLTLHGFYSPLSDTVATQPECFSIHAVCSDIVDDIGLLGNPKARVRASLRGVSLLKMIIEGPGGSELSGTWGLEVFISVLGYLCDFAGLESVHSGDQLHIL